MKTAFGFGDEGGFDCIGHHAGRYAHGVECRVRQVEKIVGQMHRTLLFTSYLGGPSCPSPPGAASA